MSRIFDTKRDSHESGEPWRRKFAERDNKYTRAQFRMTQQRIRESLITAPISPRAYGAMGLVSQTPSRTYID